AIQACTAAMTAGQCVQTALFCRALAYEDQRDFYRSIADYRQMTDPTLAEAAALGLERSQKWAMYVYPEDRQLMVEGVEYCYQENGWYRFFDLYSHSEA